MMFAQLIDGHALLAEWFLLIAVVLCVIAAVLDISNRAAVPSWFLWVILGLFTAAFLIV